jgi:hypothetical protein
VTFADKLVGTKLLHIDQQFVSKTSQPVTIPANSEALIPVNIPKSCTLELFITNPLPSFIDRKLLLTRTVVKPNTQFTFCRLLNPNDFPVKIAMGAAIALAVEIDKIVENDNNQPIRLTSLLRK